MHAEQNPENLNHTVIWNKAAYILIDVVPEEAAVLFNPSVFGLHPRAICELCQSGYYCTFNIDDESLCLNRLNIMTSDGQYPAVNGVESVFCIDDHSREYRNLRLPTGYTGTIRIGRGKIVNVFNQRDQLGAGRLLELWDMRFSNGRLIQSINQTGLADRQTQAELKIIEYVADNDLGVSRTKELLKHCRYGAPEALREKDWSDPDQHIFAAIKSVFRKLRRRSKDDYLKYIEWSNIPFFCHLQPDAAVSALALAQKSKGTPFWFIANYGDSGLSHQLTFSYLRSLGLPYRMARFLKNFVKNEVTEKMVILEFIESMLRGVAAAHWEERVMPGYLYTNAKLPPDVTSAIRSRLSTVTLESWG